MNLALATFETPLGRRFYCWSINDAFVAGHSPRVRAGIMNEI